MSALASPQRFETPGGMSGGARWMDLASCLEVDPELFFPNGNGGANVLQIEEAKAICRGCAVIDTCREYATKNKIEFGVFGGESETERKARLREENGIRRVGTAAIQGSDL